MKKLLLLSLLALLALGVRSQSADKPGNWKLIASDEYPAEDVGVATYTVTTDFNADPTGVKNSLDAFQTALTNWAKIAVVVYCLFRLVVIVFPESWSFLPVLRCVENGNGR